MREERGQVSGDVVVYEPYTLWGSVGGNVKVIEGGKLYVRGNIYGNLLVEAGGRVHIFGNVLGNVTVEKAAKVVHSGVIGGDAINNGGRLFIEAVAQVKGKVKNRKGAETTIQPPPKSLPE
jgi:cytoskeletal protein CcmA (bactofilin family)